MVASYAGINKQFWAHYSPGARMGSPIKKHNKHAALVTMTVLQKKIFNNTDMTMSGWDYYDDYYYYYSLYNYLGFLESL